MTEKLMMNFFEEIAALLKDYQTPLLNLPEYVKEKITDICFYADSKPVLFLGKERIILQNVDPVSQSALQELTFMLCDYAVYKHLEELKYGFIAIKGKFRAGVCGTAVMTNTQIDSIKNITSVTIRIPRIFFGASEELLRMVQNPNRGLLIVGEPSSGKTTLLRDLIFRFSEHRLVVLDERFELTGIGAMKGVHILCGYPKEQGIQQAIRNLGAEFIICDELEKRDLPAVESAVASGVALIATIHGNVCEAAPIRPLISEMVGTGAFWEIAVMEGRDRPCKVEKIWEVGEFLETFGRDTHYIGGRICRSY
ncbi:MAG: hypothetical protein RSC76_00920 [Oscillospiraceae bacterium]